MKKILSTLLALLLLFSIDSFSQTRKKQTTEYLTLNTYLRDGVLQKPFKIGYLAYTPDSYYLDTISYPLLITCHGNGEKGTLTPDLLRKSFLPYKLDGGLNVEMVVISPQTNGYKPKWNYAGWYRELLDSIKVKYRIDTNKIYIMGYSGGGEGVCTYVKTYPFIGVATFAPVITLTPIEKCVLVGKKLAAYHCLDDKTISPNITKNLIKDVKTCDTSFKPKVTYYQTGGHSPWKKGISDTLFNYLLSK